MLLKDLPYGRWFTISNSPDLHSNNKLSELHSKNKLSEYVFLKVNTGVAISDDSRDLFNLKYGTIALIRYYGVRCNLFFNFGLNTEVEEVKVDFHGILNSSEKHIKVRDLEKEVKELDILSVELPNQTKNKLLICIYKQADRMIIIDYESGLVIDNHYLQCTLEEYNLIISVIATIEDYDIRGKGQCTFNPIYCSL